MKRSTVFKLLLLMAVIYYSLSKIVSRKLTEKRVIARGRGGGGDSSGNNVNTNSITDDINSATLSATADATSASLITMKKLFPKRVHNATAGIPKILHQTFSSEMVYENYKQLINSCLALNPDWTYFLWRDKDAEALISAEYPEFLKRYKNYTINLQRSDSIRYIILHRFGGIYLDMDVECRRSFFPALAGLSSFLDQERIEQTNILWGWQFSAMNSAMGASPGHPFFSLMISEMLSVSSDESLVRTTGPRLLTLAYEKFAKAKPEMPISLLEPNVMSPLMDNYDKNWKQMCSASLSAESKPESQRSWKERGCLMLKEKGWRMDDTDSSTVCIHRFLHLGYDFATSMRKKPFNLTSEFWPRVRYYTGRI